MSTSLPLIRLSWIQPIVDVLNEVGAPTERLIREAGLPTLAGDDPDLLALAPRVYDFIGTAADSQGIRDLGLRAAREIDLGPLLVAGGLQSQAPILADALAAFIDLGRNESSRMRLWLELRGAIAILHYQGSGDPGDPGFELVEQFMLELLVGLIGRDAQPSWRPRRVELRSTWFPHLGATEAYQETELIGGSKALSIHFPRWRLALPVSLHSPIGDTSEKPPLPTDFVGSLREALRPYLSDGHPSILLAAHLSGLSVRTLQRRLAESSASYQTMIDGLRRETALGLIARKELKLAEVARALGYSDAAHFTRAFHRWTGVAPSTYRRQIVPAAVAAFR